MANLIIRFYPTESMTDSDFANTIANLQLEFYNINLNDLYSVTPVAIGNSSNISQKSGEAVATGDFLISGLGTTEFDSIDLRVVVKRNSVVRQKC